MCGGSQVLPDGEVGDLRRGPAALLAGAASALSGGDGGGGGSGAWALHAQEVPEGAAAPAWSGRGASF